MDWVVCGDSSLACELWFGVVYVGVVLTCDFRY